MLVLTIRRNGCVSIGDDITIHNKNDFSIRVAIQAPRELDVVREDAKIKAPKS